MSTPVSTKAADVLGVDGSPASSRVSSNTRVKGSAGALGLQTDVMQFSGPSISGTWVLAALRVKVNGIGVINQASAGTCVGTPGPMTVSSGDSRIKVM
jgi:hypothetical protein